MEAMRLGDMSWTDFERLSQTVHTVVIPTGAMECYGPHLPLASDTIVAEAIAMLISQKTGAIVGPTLPVGDSASLAMFPGTLCVRPESFKEYLRDVVLSLRKWGMRNFLFLNGHSGNVPMISQISTEFCLQDDQLHFAQIDWWRYVQTISGDVLKNEGYMAHGHASECGTSVLMYLAPQLVHLDRLCREEPKVVNGKRFPGVLRTTPFLEFSDRGMIGDASVATSEKGQILVDRCIERIADYMQKDFANF